ncbi:Phragmoplastin interacting protein 1 [Heracleum sosnowskyi]|uniref:Phragmoplastin interacting protein 1 n=1 Tax=Heracleum sosnowskyi TaxID=360622 RepID=A0AAD8GVL4_9APIA|nr:Phragmoplastin interacting protein 1 [Heracleum sosnowskyi]
MVLSNKKLKQKIRAQLTDSLISSSQNTKESFQSLLGSLTQKPRLSKRVKRRVVTSSDAPIENQENGLGLDGVKKRKREEKLSLDGLENQENGLGLDEKMGLDGVENGVNKVKKKKKKREEKVGFDGLENGVKKGEGEGEVKVKEVKGKMKKTKKKKGKKKKKSEGGEMKIVEVAKAEDRVAEVIKVNDSQENSDVSTKVYVGGIPYYSNEEDIRSFFESCGTITEVDCMRFPDTGKFRGIAFISFKTEAAAKRALALDGADMGGLFLRIQPCKTTIEKKVSDFSPAIVEGYNRIYVGNLSWDITEEDLKSFFVDFKVSSIRFGEDKETKEFRGYAHVDFTDSLYVTMALKLDQKILCGRPVRIRCAVPAKKADPTAKVVPNKADPNAKVVPTSRIAENLEVKSDNVETSAVSGKLKRRTCYECGEKGHLTSSCPNKQAADSIQSLPTSNEVKTDNVDMSAVSGKIRRRTCYECGEKGHLTSSCPKKQAADAMQALSTSKNGDNFNASTANAKVIPDNVETITVPRKMAQTCYECGEKGHLSSSCPNKQYADPTIYVPTNMNVDTVGAYTNNNEVGTVSGKIRRRTCYECGEKGHLSSQCPNKQPADSMKSVPDNKIANNDEASTYDAPIKRNIAEASAYSAPVKRNNFEVSNVSVGANNSSVDASTISGKIRRRTCYECGEKGHLSSACPKKQTTDSMVPIAS